MLKNAITEEILDSKWRVLRNTNSTKNVTRESNLLFSIQAVIFPSSTFEFFICQQSEYISSYKISLPTLLI